MEIVEKAEQTNTLNLESIPEVLPVLSLSELVVFPGIIVPMAVSNEPMVQLINDALSGDKIIACFSLKPGTDSDTQRIYKTGTCCQIMKMFRVPDGSVRLLVRGITRIILKEITQEEPYPLARIEKMRLDRRRSLNLEALTRTVSENFSKLIDLSPHFTEEIKISFNNVTDPETLADLIASHLSLELEKKQEILETWLLEDRMQKISIHVKRELKLIELSHKIQSDVDDELDRSQKEYYLREQMKVIKKELGDEDDSTVEIRELEEKINNTELPENVGEVAHKELIRLAKMNPAAAEYTVARTYLDWILALPWLKSTNESIDIEHARDILGEDHYGLEDVKERILEYLAVRKLRDDVRGPILCFAGPPGVGKTSLGRSIARALGREFARVSLGGIRDEAEIRGHRRTYIGAMPGRILQKMRLTQVNNPVFMLDEIDKMGNDFRGDPASAMLEVLDPEQNSNFSDHYIEMDFDLSRVLFITTANQIYQIPAPLRDRMEVISLSGYILPEKVAIAQRHLIPRMLEEHGLDPKQLHFSEHALQKVIREYTREAGLRNLERAVATFCRKTAMRLTQGDIRPVKVTSRNYRDFLGVPKFGADRNRRKAGVGLAYGLAWTPVGGEVMAIECSWMPGREQVHLTGHLGDVMKESADIAMSYLRSNSSQHGLKSDFINGKEIHLHIPEGATPKDGPSAGVTMAAALASLFTNRPIRDDLVMTGELTLQGKILPVGGIREKLVAAHRLRIKNVLMPKDNKQDLEEIPQQVKENMTFHFVDHVGEALKIALVAGKKKPKLSS
ncbi:endopeptidase La [candidate division LCP-89 bacterium B3_LCP]|uniref:Lon protease n=1 Tax=candidate division LCP-89 bacterium B3_LCP TaxID=2012998 RepID=A0A532V2L8_UNCL8|nr:MAG: endopeptidase La [candidate division LCP-89 bacterium B3_LCP]